jgi:hypothetical protein
MPDYTRLFHIENFGRTQPTNELENNLKMFLDWGLIQKRAWVDVAYSDADIYGGRYDVLKPLRDVAGYDDGQVWQTIRRELAYEEDTDFAPNDPTDITEVKVNGSVVTTGFNVDYPGGRVFFDTALNLSDTVQMEYSYRYIQVSKAHDSPWLRELQFMSTRADNIQWTQLGNTDLGEWTIGTHKRIQLPAIVIESTSSGVAQPYEVGNNTLRLMRDVYFHIFAETHHDRNDALDVVSLQTDRTLKLFDTDLVISNGLYPLDYRGYKVNSNTYEDIVANDSVFYRYVHLMNTTIIDTAPIHPRLFYGLVRTTCEIIL